MSRAWRPLVLALLAGALYSCQPALRDSGPRLGETQALALAVSLANEACQTRYHRAPFDAASYPVVFVDGRWQWGRLDPAGPRGYSATVSFDAAGNDREVEVYFSTDSVRSLY